METDSSSSPLRSHLADFETTISHLVRADEARALLNFAVLFHEKVYLTDTAIGDHRLIIESFRLGHSGLFHQISRLAEENILRFLWRDKVIVRGKRVGSQQKPSIFDIYEGWRHRDRAEWSGETGFTTVVDSQLRSSYYQAVDQLVSRNDVLQVYDPDIPKRAFRDSILCLLNSDHPSELAESLKAVPTDIRNEYYKQLKDPWFTNAELWRFLRRHPSGQQAIILQAHVSQQTYADLTRSGQSTHDRYERSLASFNLELQRKQPLGLEIEATINPPENLRELLQSAPVLLQSPGIHMFEMLSVEDVLSIRAHARPLFDLAAKRIESAEEREELRGAYLSELERYWNFIVRQFERRYPEKMQRPTTVGLFFEEQLPKTNALCKKYGSDAFSLLVRFAVPRAAALASIAGRTLDYLGFNFLHQTTPTAERLRSQLPPLQWKSSEEPRAILGLNRAPASAFDHTVDQ